MPHSWRKQALLNLAADNSQQSPASLPSPGWGSRWLGSVQVLCNPLPHSPYQAGVPAWVCAGPAPAGTTAVSSHVQLPLCVWKTPLSCSLIDSFNLCAASSSMVPESLEERVGSFHAPFRAEASIMGIFMGLIEEPQATERF